MAGKVTDAAKKFEGTFRSLKIGRCPEESPDATLVLAAATRLAGSRCDGAPSAENVEPRPVGIAEVRRETGLTPRRVRAAIDELGRRGHLVQLEGHSGRQITVNSADVAERWERAECRLAYPAAVRGGGIAPLVALVVAHVHGQCRCPPSRWTYLRRSWPSTARVLGSTPGALRNATAEAERLGLIQTWTHNGRCHRVPVHGDVAQPDAVHAADRMPVDSVRPPGRFGAPPRSIWCAPPVDLVHQNPGTTQEPQIVSTRGARAGRAPGAAGPVPGDTGAAREEQRPAAQVVEGPWRRRAARAAEDRRAIENAEVRARDPSKVVEGIDATVQAFASDLGAGATAAKAVLALCSILAVAGVAVPDDLAQRPGRTRLLSLRDRRHALAKLILDGAEVPAARVVEAAAFMIALVKLGKVAPENLGGYVAGCLEGGRWEPQTLLGSELRNRLGQRAAGWTPFSAETEEALGGDPRMAASARAIIDALGTRIDANRPSEAEIRAADAPWRASVAQRFRQVVSADGLAFGGVMLLTELPGSEPQDIARDLGLDELEVQKAISAAVAWHHRDDQFSSEAEKLGVDWKLAERIA